MAVKPDLQEGRIDAGWSMAWPVDWQVTASGEGQQLGWCQVQQRAGLGNCEDWGVGTPARQ